MNIATSPLSILAAPSPRRMPDRSKPPAASEDGSGRAGSFALFGSRPGADATVVLTAASRELRPVRQAAAWRIEGDV